MDKARKTYQVILGQDNDDYVGGETSTLDEAVHIARRYYDQIKKGLLPTYIYIVKPDGERLDFAKLLPTLV